MSTELITSQTLDPNTFKNLVTTFGGVPTDFEESMTYYELLTWLCNYLKTQVIPALNNNAEALEQLQNLYVELHDYVEHYFDNLDVQEEINNKLDAMVEAGTLQEIITNYLAGTVDVIFPDYGKDGVDTLGDCSIIKTANKAIMIDCFANDSTCWSRITEALYQNGITKLDYFIVSHYDGDHYGNYQRLIASGLIDNARIILPRSVVQGDINKTGNDIKTALTAAGLTYETADNETLNIDTNVTLKLFNASANDYAYYDAIPETNYNNYSVCCQINSFGKKLLFPGDILENGEQYVAANYLDSGYELIKDSHHGFNAFVNEYGRKVAPKYVVIPATNGMIANNLGYRGNVMMGQWSLYTPYIYLQGIQSSFIKFTVGTGETQLSKNSVASQEVMGGYGNYTYIVDYDNADNLRIGSSDHPFKTLAEASLLVPKSTNKNINVQVSSLGEETTEVNFSGFKHLSINFHNIVPKHLMTFNDITDLRITDLKLTDSIIQIYDCSGAFNNIESTYSVDNQLIMYRSKFHIMGDLKSQNAISSFINAQYSILTFSIGEIDFTSDTTNRILGGYGNSYIMTRGSITAFKNYKFLSEIITGNGAKECKFNDYALEELSTLYSGSATLSNIEPKENQKLYSKLKIHFVTSDNRKMIQECEASNNSSFIISTPNSNGDGFYLCSCLLSFSTDNSIIFSRNFGLTVNTSGTTTNTGKLQISKVVGLL